MHRKTRMHSPEMILLLTELVLVENMAFYCESLTGNQPYPRLEESKEHRRQLNLDIYRRRTN